MNYGNIKYNDIANGIGIRTSLFVSGCTHHCFMCFQEQTWDFNYGEEFTEKEENNIINSLKESHINGLTILGGEPFELSNQERLLPFLKRVKKECPDKTIWMYSGYLFEELIDEHNSRCNGPFTNEILDLIDILVDGEFDFKKKDPSLRFKGSSNQRIIDIKKSLKEGKIILSEYNEKEILGR